jgi:hypothetical protein
VIAGGPAPLIATALLAAYKSSVPIAIYIVVCALVSLVAVRLLPDRSGADHNVEYEDQAVTARRGADRRLESPSTG